jgi:hypothetical protein
MKRLSVCRLLDLNSGLHYHYWCFDSIRYSVLSKCYLKLLLIPASRLKQRNLFWRENCKLCITSGVKWIAVNPVIYQTFCCFVYSVVLINKLYIKRLLLWPTLPIVVAPAFYSDCPGCNPSPRIYWCDWRLSWFFSFPSGKWRALAQMRPRPLRKPVKFIFTNNFTILWWLARTSNVVVKCVVNK